MSFKTGWVKVMDAFGQTATIKLDQFGDTFEIGELDDFKDFIEAHSDAKVVAAGVSEVVRYDASGLFADETDKGSYDAINQRLVFHFMDADSGKRISFSIPAPRDEDVDKDQQPTKAAAAAVRSQIADITSRDQTALHYLGGGLRSKVPPIERRRKQV